MTPQVKDFEAFLALAAPATPPPFPPQQHTPPPSQQHTPSSTASFFEDISHLEDTIHNSTPTTATPNPFSNVPLSPIQLVAISNLKLNNDMYSNRSLSIHRRILVKNFLTLLYQLSPPMDWMSMQHTTYGSGDAFEPLPGLDAPEPDEGSMLLREDEQNGWMERTLSAAGLSDDDDHDPVGTSSKNRNTKPFATPKPTPTTPPPTTTTTSSSSSSAPPSLTLSFNASSSSSSSSTSSNKPQPAPLPRPKSTELPQTLHSYLSTVFDVDWSVELPSKEDILFTHAPSNNPSTSSSSPSPAISSVASKRKSITAASGLSSAFTAYSNGNASSYSATSASPRSSTASTSSSFSSVSATSTVSSASSVGSIGNGSILIGFNKPGQLSNGNNNLTGATKTTPAAITLVRKSSLPSSQPPSSTQAVNSPPANNSGNNTNGVSSDSKNLPVRKASINGHSKPMLVPGRRSSLLQAGQMPPALPTSKNNNTPNSIGINGLGRANSVATSGEAARSLSPAMSLPPSLPPSSLSPPTLSPPPSFTSASTSPTLSPSKPTSPTMTPSKPTFSRRTSSLPAERPKPVQRTPSSETNLSVSTTTTPSTANATTLSVPQANIIGLPRPLLSPTLSSAELSSSPPSLPTMTTPSTNTASPASGATRYMRSASDDQITARPNNTPYALNGFMAPEKSPSSPNLCSTTNGSSTPYSSPPPPPPAQSGALSRPSPTYLKTSKSSPCLVGSESVSQDKPSFPPLPDLYFQQQYQSQDPSHQSSLESPVDGNSSGTGAGLRLLARTSSRRGMASPTGGSEMLAPSQGAMNISAPLPLIPSSPSYNDYAGYDNHNQNNSNNNNSPYGHGHGHAYAQSMSNVSVMSSSSVMTSNTSKTNRSQASEKPAAGRWSSMKTMFGLRGGQSTKG
ncbi:hypothetical protein BGX26_004894 [Mortierella sp. AD094]|nr:hypothetical protein BGX26_004894 [Mortierella sp. AD094]